MTGSSVLTEVDAGVARIVLNRPQVRNALDREAWRALGEVILDVSGRADVRAVVLSGAGRNFCSGADLSDPGLWSADEHPLIRSEMINRVATALIQSPKPMIAKVEGYAIGAGWSIALACDFVVSTPQAQFSQIYSKRGLSMDLGASWVLPRMVGLLRAKRLAMLAEFIDGQTAFDWQLVSHLFQPNEIDEATDSLAATLAAGAPIALAQTKALLNASLQRTLPEALDAEAAASAVNRATADVQIAAKAWKEGTEPVFTGRWRTADDR